LSKEVAPPLVEREGLLRALRERLQAATQQGHVTLPGGEAGIGKTSVLRALAVQHSADGGTVWWGEAPQSGRLSLVRRTVLSL